MVERDFDIEQHFEAIYGFKPKPFQVAPANLQPQFSKKGSVIYTELLGVKYYLPVMLDAIELLHAVMSIQGKKTIVRTPMVSRKGTVKELISIDDYKIVMDIFLKNDLNTFPEDEIQTMVDLWEKNQSIKLQCALTDFFLSDDDSVVITSIDFPPMRGVINVRRARLEIESDSIFELEVTTTT